MPSIFIEPDTYDRLTEQAEVAGQTIEALVAPVLASMAAVPLVGRRHRPTLSHEEFTRLLDSMAIDLPDVPPSDITHSREDIYFDHD